MVLSWTPSSLEDKSEDTGKFFLHVAGLPAGLPIRVEWLLHITGLRVGLPTVKVWFKCDLDFNGGRAGEELGVLTGVVDTELPFITCSKVDWPLVHGWAKICSSVGLSLGLIASIQEMRSLASTENKNKGQSQ